MTDTTTTTSATTTTRPDMLLWVDVETTGLDPTRDQLLEAGMRVTHMDGTADPATPPLSMTIHPKEPLTITSGNLPAIRMHAANNLLGEALTDSLFVEAAEPRIRLWLERAAGMYTLHPAGTNPQFDIQWLTHTMPSLQQAFDHMSYRRLDMTALRLTARTLGADTHDPTPARHRVDDCLTRDTDEYTSILTRLATTKETTA